ncbi:DUF3883 domain-containing protein [Acinetobacter sp. AGC35]
MGSINTKYRNNLPVSDATERLVKFIESKGGKNVHDSRHQRQISKDGYALAGGLVYEFPHRKGLMIQLNADLPSIYVKSILSNGQHIFDVLPEARKFNKPGKVYTENKKGHSTKGYHAALDHEDWLAPSSNNPVVLLSLIEIDIAKKVVDLISDSTSANSEILPTNINNVKTIIERGMSVDKLIEVLDRQEEIGKKGEEIAYQWEYARIFVLANNPKLVTKAITRTALDNVSAGYDMESHYEGESRYIEVKTTTSKANSDFYFSLNEYEVLKSKGKEAYIYRVVLDENGSEHEVIEIHDPFGENHPEELKAVAFKAKLSDFKK